jgi:acetyltransferase-like isoleucine patch superfamily enzyme
LRRSWPSRHAGPERAQKRVSIQIIGSSVALQFVLKGARVLRAMILFRLHRIEYEGIPYVRGQLPRISNAGRISAGTRLRIDGLQHRVDIGTGREGVLEIGDNVFINRGVTIYAARNVSIGDNTRIADLAAIHDTDLHEVEQGHPVKVAPVSIGRNVWIGRGAVILPGVAIGDHSVIAACAVVSRDVPARTLVAGVPASATRRLQAADEWIRR